MFSTQSDSNMHLKRLIIYIYVLVTYCSKAQTPWHVIQPDYRNKCVALDTVRMFKGENQNPGLGTNYGFVTISCVILVNCFSLLNVSLLICKTKVMLPSLEDPVKTN